MTDNNSLRRLRPRRAVGGGFPPALSATPELRARSDLLVVMLVVFSSINPAFLSLNQPSAKRD